MAMAKHSIYTAGYAGFDQEGFLAKLELFKVAVVIDIRQKPISRNHDFTRSRLQPFLEQNGIQYLHLQELGVPTEYRDELKKDGDLKEYFKKFRRYLAGQKDTLQKLYKMATQQTCCLLCLEKVPSECHRSVVGDCLMKLNGQKLEVQHI
jgi:uncharacterized protein (DUF488 family)